MKKEQELSKVSDFIIYFIMYLFTCFAGTIFVGFARSSKFIIELFGLKISGEVVLSSIFLVIIAVLLNELFRLRKNIAEYIFGLLKNSVKVSEELQQGLESLLAAFLLVPLLLSAGSYFYPLCGAYSILIIIILFIIMYYYIFQFVKSWKSDLEKLLLNIYQYIKKKKEEKKE
ncbi:MAG: hypothetical protein GXO42_00210 [bacterium]|nr:hypothetical protein [bacterium]